MQGLGGVGGLGRSMKVQAALASEFLAIIFQISILTVFLAHQLELEIRASELQ